LVDLDECSDEDECQHIAQSGYALTAHGKRPRNAVSKTQSDCGDSFQPVKRIRLEKSHEGGEEDVSMGGTELTPHIAPTTPSFVGDEDLLLSDQDEDESRVLASLEQEEEDIMFDDGVMLDSDSAVDRDAVVDNIDDKLRLQEESSGKVLFQNSSQRSHDSPATPIGNVLVPNSSQSSTTSLPTGHNSSPASPALKATVLGPLQDVEEDLFAQLPEITPDMTRAMDALEASDTLRRLSAKNMPREDRAAKFLVIPFVTYL
jgi:hypothetical protein